MSQDTSQDNGAQNCKNCEAVDFTTWLDALDVELAAELAAAIAPIDFDTFSVPAFDLSSELAKRERRQPGRRRRRQKHLMIGENLK